MSIFREPLLHKAQPQTPSRYIAQSLTSADIYLWKDLSVTTLTLLADRASKVSWKHVVKHARRGSVFVLELNVT